ncbi:hypothetical protein SmJEL517_g01957 [Synchytrium microbalum]|uniref:PHD-type domain-containing protein n=1 Tax=Synchytrium microbalum TaxID=1806994 RepID=A0A507C443_9FUNG|nr:uncharacterized protein SmJEL517_g01957 [Synchytrium microbalum]TPX35737.1 hypothetical protein SmJEL517_g01957 [Synchytrium microbalum]
MAAANSSRKKRKTQEPTPSTTQPIMPFPANHSHPNTPTSSTTSTAGLASQLPQLDAPAFNPKDLLLYPHQPVEASPRGNRVRTRGGRYANEARAPHPKTRDASCLCGLGFDGVEFVITCHTCHDWFHGRCVGISSTTAPFEWICPHCRPANASTVPVEASGQKRKKPSPPAVSKPATPILNIPPTPSRTPTRKIAEEVDDDDDLCPVCDGECTCNTKQSFIVTPIIEVETATMQMTAIGSPQTISPARRGSPKTPRGTRSTRGRSTTARKPKATASTSTSSTRRDRKSTSRTPARNSSSIVIVEGYDSSEDGTEQSFAADIVSAMVGLSEEEDDDIVMADNHNGTPNEGVSNLDQSMLQILIMNSDGASSTDDDAMDYYEDALDHPTGGKSSSNTHHQMGQMDLDDTMSSDFADAMNGDAFGSNKKIQIKFELKDEAYDWSSESEVESRPQQAGGKILSSLRKTVVAVGKQKKTPKGSKGAASAAGSSNSGKDMALLSSLVKEEELVSSASSTSPSVASPPPKSPNMNGTASKAADGGNKTPSTKQVDFKQTHVAPNGDITTTTKSLTVSVASNQKKKPATPRKTPSSVSKSKKNKSKKTDQNAASSSSTNNSASNTANNTPALPQPPPLAVSAFLAALLESTGSAPLPMPDAIRIKSEEENGHGNNSNATGILNGTLPNGTSSNDTTSLDGIVAGVQAALQASPMSSVLATFAAIANATGNPGLIAALTTVAELLMANGTSVDNGGDVNRMEDGIENDVSGDDTSNNMNTSDETPAAITKEDSVSSSVSSADNLGLSIETSTESTTTTDSTPHTPATIITAESPFMSAPLKLDEVLDTDRLESDNSESVVRDTPLSPVAVAIARWKTVPIGSFRRSRRTSVHGRTSAAALATAVRPTVESPTMGSSLGVNSTLADLGGSPGLAPLRNTMIYYKNANNNNINHTGTGGVSMMGYDAAPSVALGGLLNASPLFAPLDNRALSHDEDNCMLVFEPPPLSLPESMSTTTTFSGTTGSTSMIPLSPPPSATNSPVRNGAKGKGKVY